MFGLSRLDHGVAVAVLHGVAFALAVICAGFGATFAMFAASEREPLRVTAS